MTTSNLSCKKKYRSLFPDNPSFGGFQMTNANRVTLSCACGAAVGAAVGAAMTPIAWYLFIVGGLVGGLVGWSAYVAPKLPAAIRRTWVAMTSFDRRKWWMERKTLVLLSAKEAGISLLLSITHMAAVCGFFAVDVGKIIQSAPAVIGGIALIATALFTTISLLLLYCALGGGVQTLSLLFCQQKKAVKIDIMGPKDFLLMTPPGLIALSGYGLFLMLKKLPWATLVTLKFSGRAAVWCGQFVWRVIIAVHSDLAMLCLVDSAIGAISGILAGPRLIAAYWPLATPTLSATVAVSAIAGAAVGAAWGWLNYQVVTVRLLKLVPAKAPAK